MRTRPLTAFFALFLSITLACESPTSGTGDITAFVDARTGVIDAPSTSIDAPMASGPCADNGFGEPLDPEQCADCLTNNAGYDVGDCNGPSLDVAAAQCGANPSTLIFGGWKCARTLALAGLAIGGVVGGALGVAGACTAGQAAVGAGQLACIGAVLVTVVAAGALVISLIDIITDCPWARARACAMAQRLVNALQAAVNGVAAFTNGLPPAVANAPIRNFPGGGAFPPGVTVRQAMTAVQQQLNGQIARLQAELNGACAAPGN